MKNLAQYRKALIALAGVLLVVGKVLSDGDVSSEELGAIVVATATAIGVFATPNASS